VLLALVAADQLGGSQERPTQLADTAYSTPLPAPAPPPQARKTPPGGTRGKARKSRQAAKHRRIRPHTRGARGSKRWHAKPAHSKAAYAKKPAPAKPSGPLPAASNAKAATAVHEALSLLGIPYVWGGTTRAGFDCSGLTQHVWAKAGVKIPRTVHQQAEIGTPVPLNQAHPGDLVVFYPSRHHVGIYVGNGLVVDAPHTGSWVRTDPIRSMPVSIVVRPYA